MKTVHDGRNQENFKYQEFGQSVFSGHFLSKLRRTNELLYTLFESDEQQAPDGLSSGERAELAITMHLFFCFLVEEKNPVGTSSQVSILTLFAAFSQLDYQGQFKDVPNASKVSSHMLYCFRLIVFYEIYQRELVLEQ